MARRRSAVLAIVIAVLPAMAWGQDLTPIRRAPGPPKAEATPPKPAAPTDEQAAKARLEAEAKAREWDRRLKRSMGSICRGAPGC